MDRTVLGQISQTETNQKGNGSGIRALMLEDVKADVQLVARALRSAGLAIDIHHVDTREAFIQALAGDPWDIIIGDYILPGFGAAEALEIVRDRGLDTPFIILSGIATTEDVVMLMKAGAGDFVQKDDLARLAPAITREIRDVNDRRACDAAEREVRQLSRAVEQSPVSVMILNANGEIDYTNRQFSETTGYQRDDVRHRKLEDLYQPCGEDGVVRGALAAVQSSNTWQGELKSLRKDGAVYWESLSVSALRAPDGAISHFVVVGEDITLRKVYADRLMHQAHFDSLTDLPNRFLSIDRLNLALARGRRQSSAVAVGFIDLDDFKKVNDTLGHACGDRLLKEAAQRLLSCVRAVDTIGRLGGDEFVFILPDLLEPMNVEIVAEKILASFRRPFLVEGHEVSCTASVGLTTFPSDGDDTQTLLRNADSAMYQAKRQGKNTFRYYMQRMNEQARRRLDIEEKLRHSLASGEVTVAFQPIVDIKTTALSGMEALVRWSHDVLGEVAPLEFIPIAEDSGLIEELGAHVLMVSCCECQRLSTILGWPLRLSVNVSSRQVQQNGFRDTVADALSASGLAASRLELEITERLLLADEQRSRQNLSSLRDLGIGVAIDDFGTGYSSLSYVKRFPVSTIKIDRSFIEGLPDDSGDVALVRAIIAMAHALDLEVVAEGVETSEQAIFLREEGCDYAQGFLFAKPLFSEAFTDFVETGGIAGRGGYS